MNGRKPCRAVVLRIHDQRRLGKTVSQPDGPILLHNQIHELFETSFAEEAARVKTATATSTVLSTTELVEGILQYLPFNELLRAQRISRYIYEIIHGSIQLQRQLFFEPSAPQEAIISCVERDRQAALDLVHTTNSQSSIFIVTAFHPILRPKVTHRSTPAEEDPELRAMLSELGMLNLLDMQRLMRMLKSGGSWQRMLSSQPPVFEVTVWYIIRLSSRTSPGPRAVVHDSNGRPVGFEPKEQRKEADGSWTEFYDLESVVLKDAGGVRLGQIALALKEALARREAERGGSASFEQGGHGFFCANEAVADDSRWVTDARARKEESTKTA
ncbi:hypothetical protein LTR37_014264 [Vermiconidia calcicola]|uniref:Uncharacterized protein n=1 Tax=Vermiconidia calcicola TaxID=1690605 RepID=A0ACC3MTX8_9PEZI|nr:hypothetical protein LTR37_014264 [Vermiconidia calcicola]